MNNGLTPNINVNWVPGITLEEMEKQTILQAFRFYRSNKTQTAQALGIAIRTLDNKLEKYEADGKEREQRESENETKRVETLNRMRGIIPAQTLDPIRASSYEAPSGVHVQPPVETSQEYSMPVSKPKEVQSVLPRQASSGGKHSRR